MSHWGHQREYYDIYVPQFAERRQAIVIDSESDDEPEPRRARASSDEDYTSRSSDLDTDSDDDNKRMSNAGQLVNDADKRVIARYIASLGSDWNNMTSRERWATFENIVR